MNRLQIILFCLAFLSTHANQPVSVNLASGHRGLVFARMISKDSASSYDTVAFACNLTPGYDVTTGFDDRDPDSRVILKEKLTPEYIRYESIKSLTNNLIINIGSQVPMVRFVHSDTRTHTTPEVLETLPQENKA